MLSEKTIDGYLALDIRKLNRLDLSREKLNQIQLNRGEEESGSILVEVLEGGDLMLHFNAEGWREELVNPIHQRVSICRTRTGFGERRWFLCPFCGERRAILYSYPYFMCRICVGLPYGSQSQSTKTRRLGKAVEQRLKMGGTGSLLDPFPPRPKGMRETTYGRLKREDSVILAANLDDLERKIGALSEPR
jgi:hypothetical protein